MSSNRVSGVPAQLRSLSRTLTDVAPELERVATRLTSARIPEMPASVTAVVSGTLSQVGESMRRAAVAVTREGLDVQRRSLWLEIAGAGGLLVTLHRPRPRGLWEPFPELGFGPFPGGVSPPPERGPEPERPDFTPPPEPRPLPGFPPVLGIPLPPLDPKDVPDHLPPSYDKEG